MQILELIFNLLPNLPKYKMPASCSELPFCLIGLLNCLEKLAMDKFSSIM